MSDPTVNADQRFPLIAVVPVTGTPGEGSLYPSLAPGSSGLTKTSYVLTDHVRSIDKRRIRRTYGQVSTVELTSIDQGLGLFLGLLAMLFLLAAPVAVGAQTFESVGNRAQGMGGAFVAVADDATLTWWNPAGVATAGQLSALFEHGTWDVPAVYLPAGPAMRNVDTGFAMTFPGFGASYYRVNVSELRPVRAPESANSIPQVSQRKLALSQYGFTTGQSIGKALTIASTLKLVRVGAISAVSPVGVGNGVGVGDPMDAAQELVAPVETKGDLDLGVMASLGALRLGFTLKHLSEPDFYSPDGPFVLSRQARLGAAYRTSASAASPGLTVAFDTDLTSASTPFGDVRHIAVGAEGRLRKWVGLRGGFSANSLGETRPSWSGGLSLGAAGFFVDGALTFGKDESKRGWNIGVRVAL